ncbi:hypothetical protein [Aquimarina rubra]|uniref:DUF5648 domain-containing protein n=1 Tax=Aquimarina rubra TaxID=1920033 RepID=A0ABW5LK15_9FLAO
MKKSSLVFNSFLTLSLLLTFSCSEDEINDGLNESDVTDISKRLPINIDSNEGSGSGNGSGNNSGVRHIYRFYKDGSHLYTVDYNEGVNAGFNYEGILGSVLSNGPTERAITRWHNLANGDRVITTDVRQHPAILNDIQSIYYYNAYGSLVLAYYNEFLPGTTVTGQMTSAVGRWRYEGILGYADDIAGNKPVYTYYNSVIKDHLYTYDFNELGNGGQGYVYEGVSLDL